ncbi:Calmodulin-like protein 5, partial [Mortierella hygrophila]
TVSNPFTPAETADLKESFNAFDRNNDGTISRRELHLLLHTVGHKVNATGLETLLAKYDADQSGNIDFEEFLALAGTLIKNKVASK